MYIGLIIEYSRENKAMNFETTFWNHLSGLARQRSAGLNMAHTAY